MSIYTNPPEWEDAGKKPPSSKRTEGWKPGDRVPASWLNWFWFSTVNSLREIAQAFVNHRDASAPHDGHETKDGATAKVEAHSAKTTGVHGVGQQYVAKTSRSDQWPSWNDIPDKPSTFPVDAATLPQASTSQAGIVQLTNSRSNTSETLAVAAKALNDHRNSADHDGRYYTKAQLDQILEGLGDSSKTASGYVWLPGGLLLQWGRSDHINADSSATVNFPIPFPNQCLQVVATKFNSSSANDDVFCTVQGFSNTSVTFRMEEPSFGSISGKRYAVYFAIGY